MLRRDVGHQAVAVAAHGVHQRVARADFRQQFGRLGAVLVGELFKVHVVQKAGRRPEIGVRAEAELVCKPAHHSFYRQRVLDVKVLLVVFFEK